MARRVRLDSRGLGEVLRSAEVRAELSQLAEGIARNAESSPEATRNTVRVDVQEYTARGGRLRGERVAFAVTLAGAAGLAIEAKHGTLSRAAASQGLTVKGGG